MRRELGEIETLRESSSDEEQFEVRYRLMLVRVAAEELKQSVDRLEGDVSSDA